MSKIPKFKYYFLISDIVIFIAATIITSLLINTTLEYDLLSQENMQIHWSIFLISTIVAFVFIFSINNLYRINVILTRSAHLTSIIKSIWYSSLLIVLALFFIEKTKFTSVIIIVISFVICFVFLIYFLRVEVLRKVYMKLKNNQFKRDVLIIGDGKAGKMLAAKLAFENPIGINIIGFVDENKPVGEIISNGLKVLGKYSDINNLVKTKGINELLIASDNDDYENILKLIDTCQGTNTRVKITSDLFNIVPKKVFTDRYANIPVIDVSPIYNNKIVLRLKSVIDLVCAISGLLLLWPIFIFISVLIKLDSKGPVFYKQIRIGKNGKPFMFYKFRTMYLVSNDEDRKKRMINFIKGKDSTNGAKIKSDDMITKVGRILRKLSLDELPQLVNVILGNMSLVGPRPCLPYEYDNYNNWQKRRFNVTPGCTGVWQVLGRSSVSFNDSIILDLYYINNMSPWLDLQLMLKTIPVILFGKGGG